MPEETKMFDPAIMKKIEEAISQLDKIKPILDKDGKKLWFRDKVSKGFTVQEVMQKLKEVNYDFTAAGTYLDNTYNSRVKSQKAMEEVVKLKEDSEKKVQAEKTGARLSWIFTAFSISAVSIFSSVMIKRTVGDTAPELTASAVPGGDILGSFMKGGWILGGAAAGVGLLLLAFFMIERYSKKTQTEDKEQNLFSLQKNEQEALAESQRKEIEAELAGKVQ